MAHQTIYIIGAGIIGVSCGVNLARRGFAVHYIDHREPGSAASFGNAGALVSFGVLPEAAPEVFRKALRWMLQKDGFVKMQPRYLPQMVEWFYHYWKASKRSNLHPATKALSQLVAYSQKTLWPTVAETNAGALVERSGGLSVYDDAASLAAEVASLDAYKEVHGYDFGYETLSPEELFQAEPDLPRVPRYGLLSPDDAAIRNPGELVNRWFQSSLEGGGSFIKNRVRGFETEQRKIARILLQDGKDIALGDAAVLAATPRCLSRQGPGRIALPARWTTGCRCGHHVAII
jgi:D-amino-acid dehydrogenase